MSSQSATPLHALVPIADGSEEIEAITIIDTLRRAQMEVTVAAVTPERERLLCVLSRKTKVQADVHVSEVVRKDESGEWEATREFDVIVLPGGYGGAQALHDSDAVVALLKQQDAAGRWLAAICAAPAVVLEPHGLLKGRQATCYPAMVDQLTDASAAEQRVVVSNKCVTSRGPGTALEFALAVVREVAGEEVAKATKDPMVCNF